MSNWTAEFYELNPDAIKVNEEKTTVKQYKNDLFGVVIPALDRRDKKFYGKLNEEQQKDIGVWILTRWMSSTRSNPDIQICNVNAIVNSRAKFLTKHKELQWMLLAMTGTGKPVKHDWIAPPKGVKKNRFEEAVLQYFPGLSNDELELFQKVNTVEDLEEFFIDNGFSDKEIEELLKGK